jgi:cell division protein FtsQ
MLYKELEINTRVARRPGVVKQRIKRMIRAAIISAAVILLIVMAVIVGNKLLNSFIKHPDYRIKKVYVQNNITLSAQEILRIAHVTTNMNIYAVALEPIQEKLMRHPDIRTAEIKKRPPDMLIIKVEERSPAAVIRTAGDSWDIPVDVEGVMLSHDKMKYALEKPHITGYESIKYVAGNKIDDPRIRTALSFIAELQHAPGTTYIKVKEINVTTPETVKLKTASINEVVIGTTFSPDIVMEFLATVDDLRFKRINAQKIDLRFKDVIVTPQLL